MSLRAYTDHVDDYNRTHTIEIHKSGYSGSVDYLKNTGSGYASFDYEKIDPKNPTDNPIQKGALEFSLWLQSSTLIDEIKTADEQTFWAIHKVDGTQEWIGYIYNDLSTYEEGFENHPFRITLMAKDFTDLGGKDYLVSGILPDSRERVIATIAHLLDTVGFDMPIKTHTSWVEENLTGDYDYLNEIYHETKALREFGRTGDESDQPITVEDALNKLCVNHGLLLKQADGAYWIDQLTEYEDPDSVQEAEYDLTGTQTAFSTTNDLTVDANTSDLKVTIQQDNRDNSGPPGLKRVTNKFNHRSTVSAPRLPNAIYLTGNEDRVVSNEFIPGNDQRIEISAYVFAEYDEDHSSGEAEVKIRVGQYYFDGDNWTTDNTDSVTISLLGSGQQIETPAGEPNYYRYNGFLNKITPEIPPDAQSPIEITFFNALINASPDVVATNTIYDNISFRISNLENSTENATSVNFQLTQTGSYSVVNDLEDTWFGDGPSISSVSALRYSENANADITSNSWRRRGQTIDYRRFHHNLLAEHLDVRRGWRRLLSATLKGKYYAWQILSYDSEYFYFLGGSWDLFTGNWEGELFSLDIETASDDEFDDIPKFSDSSGTGSTSSGGASSGGVDTDTGDQRWLNESANLSDLDSASDAISNLGIDATASELNRLDGDLATVRSNLGLTDASADLDLNSLAINGDDLFSLFYTEQEINSFFDLYYSKADLTDGDEDLHLNTLELESGKFLSPTSYQFRNAGDTAFRDVEMAGLTATGGSFSSALTIDTESTLGAVRIMGGDDSTLSNSYRQISLRYFNDGFAHSIRTRHDSGNDSNNRIEFWLWQSSQSNSAEGNFRALDLVQTGSKFYTPLEISGRLTGTDADFSGTLDVGDDTLLQGALTVDLDATFKDDVFVGDATDATVHSIEPLNFSLTTDFTGVGWQGTDEGDFNIRNLVVREAARFRHLIIDELGIIAGSDLRSIARGKIKEVDPNNNQVVLENPRDIAGTSWVQNDFFWVKAVDIDGGIFLDLKGQVTNVDTTNSVITLTLDTTVAGGTHDGGTTDISNLSVGNVLVQRGHPTNTDRQSLIYTTVSDSDAPVQKWFTDVDSLDAFNNVGNVQFASGNVSSLSSEVDFGLFGRDFDIQAGNDYWRTSDNTGSVGDGVLTWDGNATEVGLAGFTATADQFSNSGVLMSSVSSFSDISSSDLLGFNVHKTASNNAIDIFVGRTIVSDATGWDYNDTTGAQLENGNPRHGIQIFSFPESGFSNPTPLFEVSVREEGDAPNLKAQIAGANFDAGAMWAGGDGTKANATFLADWANETLEMGSVFSADGGADTGRLASSYFDSTDLWGGDATKANATVRLDFANGQIYYDAMSKLVYGRSSEATLDSQTGAPLLTDDYWAEQAIASSGASDTSDNDKVYVTYIKRFGEERLKMQGQLFHNLVNNPNSGYARVTLSVDGSSDSYTKSNGDATQDEFTLDVDISSLSDDTKYIISVNLESHVESDGGNSNDQISVARLFEDLSIYTTTD